MLSVLHLHCVRVYIYYVFFHCTLTMHVSIKITFDDMVLVVR